MTIIIEHFFIFFQISIISLFLSVNGFLLKKLIFLNHDIKNFEENGLFGFIFIGFIALTINFFYPLNIFINNIFFILIVISAFLFDFFNQNIIKLIKRIFFISLVGYILFIYSNVNTPDALLYHLPYSRIVNENKILIGLSNIHFRFGHISIFQYIASFFNNTLFKTNGLLLPIGVLTSFFFLYTYRLFKNEFKKDNSRLKSYFTFLILIFSLYSFNRYSGYGNDAQVHIYYFLGILYILDFFIIRKSFLIFKKISLVLLFTFLIKPFYLISIIIPCIIFFLIKKDYIIIRSRFFIFSSLFLIFWIIKNLLITGCLIYPVQSTCSKNLIWYDKDTRIVSTAGEAWSKAWPQNLKKDLNQAEFNKDFNWVNAWSKTHLNVIIEKLFPVLFFIILNFLFLYFTKSLKKNYHQYNSIFYLLGLFISFLFVLLWFLKFPIYRYGLSFIYTLILSLIFFIFVRNINTIKIKKYYNFFTFFIILFTSLILIKNIDRISNNLTQSISPSLNDKFDDGKIIKIFNKDKLFTYYNKKSSCGYTISPCSHIKRDLGKQTVLGYSIYYNY